MGGPAGPDSGILKLATRGRSLLSNPIACYEVKVSIKTKKDVPILKFYYEIHTLFHNKILMILNLVTRGQRILILYDVYQAKVAKEGTTAIQAAGKHFWLLVK